MEFNKISDTEVSCFLTNKELEEHGVSVGADIEGNEELKNKVLQQFFDLTLKARDLIAKKYNLPVQCVDYVDTTPEDDGATLNYKINESTVDAYNYLNNVLGEVSEYLSNSFNELKKELIFELVVAFLSHNLWETAETYFKPAFLSLVEKHLSKEDIELYLAEELSSPTSMLSKEVVKYINSHPEARERYDKVAASVRLNGNFTMEEHLENSITTSFADNLNDMLNKTMSVINPDNSDNKESDDAKPEETDEGLEHNYTNADSDSSVEKPLNSFNIDEMYDESVPEPEPINKNAALLNSIDIGSLLDGEDTENMDANDKIKMTFNKLRDAIPEELLDIEDNGMKLGDYLDYLENISTDIEDKLGSECSATDKINFMKEKMQELKNSNYRKIVGGKFNSIKELEDTIKKLNSWDSTRFLSSLYLTPKKRYIIILSATAPDLSAFNSCVAALVRDGVLFPSDALQLPYIEEHCELLIKDNAIEVITLGE